MIFNNAEKAVVEFVSRLEMCNIDFEKNGFNSIEHIKSRIKTEESIKKKLQAKNREYNEENILRYIHDLGGVRATVLFVEDAYRILKYIRYQKDFEVIRIKDYIKKPKKSGYQSLHMNILIPIHVKNETIKVEVELQIRTAGMDFFASVEHLLKYKNKNIDASISKRLIDCSKHITSLDKEMYELYQLLK